MTLERLGVHELVVFNIEQLNRPIFAASLYTWNVLSAMWRNALTVDSRKVGRKRTARMLPSGFIDKAHTAPPNDSLNVCIHITR